MRRVAVTGLGALAVAALAACGGKKDPVLALLSDLEKAAEARSAERIEERLTEDFRAQGGMPRADVGPMLRRYFAAYETVNLEVYEVQVERGEAEARVRFRVDFDGRPVQFGPLAGFLPPSAMYRFDLGLKRADGVWRVAEAGWEELPPGPGS
jgi:hypothetical protein